MKNFSDKSQATSASLLYLPALDAFRALAVSLVIFHHYCGGPDVIGPIGVWIFFVISGFLITRILLNARTDTPGDSRRALFNFYIRRFLRIFPLYYFVLILSFAVSVKFRESWYWYATYLQNFKMMGAKDPVQVFGVHFWSLAVEEQFYLFWPLFMLFLPRVWLLPTMLLAIVIGVVSRSVCAAMGLTMFQGYVFTLSNLDMLGLGALLAWFVTYRSDKVVPLRRVAFFGSLVIWAGESHFRLSIMFMALPTGLLALWWISHIAAGIPGIFGRLVALPPSVYVGRISYGIYVYHFFVPIALKPMLHRFHIEDGHVLFVIICIVVTIVISSLSWFLLEKPINSLKSRFKQGMGGSLHAIPDKMASIGVEPIRL